jgi:dTDP-4-dehydrorhamnose reductase
MKNKILVLGRGYLGQKIKEDLDTEISDKKIFSYADAERIINHFNPSLLINCIGATGRRNVDDCELIKDKALIANSFVPIILAEVALRRKIRLVHISSGCIFHYDYSKDQEIDEEIIPDYLDLFYSRTKIYSEMALKTLSKEYPILILRIRIPLDNRPHPKNLLTKLIRYGKVIDLANSVTYLPDFIQALRHLVNIGATGIYNVVNRGGLRYPELMDVYKKYVPDYKYKIINYKALKLTRTNLILSVKKLRKTGFKVRDIHDVLEECVKEYLKY